MLKFLGANLHRLIDDDQGDEFQRAARHIRNFFAPELGIASVRIYSFDVPQFLLPVDCPVALIDPVLFAAQMQAVVPPEFGGECSVLRNLDGLTELLHLTRVERKLLLWSYCAEAQHPAVLKGVLGCVPCENWADAIEALSILLEEPAIAVAICLASPFRLRALRLVLTDTLRVPSSLAQCLQASETLVEVLETVHLSKTALLADLQGPRSHWTLQPESDVADGLLVAWFDLPVADVFAAALNERRLTAPQIAVAITWLTGWQIPAEQYQPLAEHLTFDLIELTVQRCFVDHGQRHRSVTVLALMQALYVAAS